jgi:hypothetical protein
MLFVWPLNSYSQDLELEDAESSNSENLELDELELKEENEESGLEDNEAEEGQDDSAEDSEEEKPTSKQFDGINPKTLRSSLSSVFFSESELEEFYDVYQEFMETGELPTIDEPLPVLDKIVKKEEEKKEQVQTVFTAPVFYLSSILIPENDKWTFWLNDTKYRGEDIKTVSYSDFIFVSVDEVNLTLMWTSSDFDKIALDYQRKLNEINPPKKELINNDYFSWDYGSEKGDVMVDSSKRIVKFSLGQSQTFSVYDMKVFEGRKKAIEIVNGKPEVKGSPKNGSGNNRSELRLE